MHEMVKESQRSIHSVRPPPSNQIFKKGGLTGPQLLERVTFSRGVAILKKRKSEIFNGKKVYKQK